MMILLPLALAFADKVPQKCGEGFVCWQKSCVGIGPGTPEAPRCNSVRCFHGSKEIAMTRDKSGRLYCGAPTRKKP